MNRERAGDVLERMTLLTREQQPVVDVYLPKFRPRAEIVQWGERTFVWNGLYDHYIEGMAFWVSPELVAED
jgi:hypothetical protein